MKKYLLLLLAMLPMLALHAQTDYGLTICGTPVTDDNCNDVLGDGVFSYDGDELTLTINGDATATGSANVIRNTGSGLRIKLKSDSKLTASSSVITTTQQLEIMGPGELTLESEQGYGIYYDQKDAHAVPCRNEIENITLNVTGKYGLSGTGASKEHLFIEESTVHAIGTVAAMRDFGGGIGLASATPTRDQMSIITPQGATIVNGTVYDKDGNAAKDVLIGSENKLVEKYHMEICGKRVTSANCSDVLGDGVFSYDPSSQVLTINGDAQYTAANEPLIKFDKAKNTKIRVLGDSKLTNLHGGAVISFMLGDNGMKTLELTGPGKLTLESPYGTGIRSSLCTTFEDITVESSGRYGFEGVGDYASLVFTNSSVTIVSELGAVTNFKGGITMGASMGNETQLLSPQKGTTVDGTLLDSEGNVATEAQFGPVVEYDLWVKGNQVSNRNNLDVLGDGVFSYDIASNTLTINGGEHTLNTNIIQNGIDGLTINVASDVTMSSYSACIKSSKSFTLTGEGKLTVESSGEPAIQLSKNDATCVIENIQIDATGEGAAIAANYNQASLSKLVIRNATLHAVKSGSGTSIYNDMGAFAFFTGGIELDGVYIAQPEGAMRQNGTIVDSESNPANDVFIKPDTGELRYNILSDTTVEVVAPPTGGAYKGYIGIPAQVELDGKTYDVIGIADYAFSSQNELKSVFWFHQMQYIGENAFAYSRNLTMVAGSCSASQIKPYTFAGCEALSSCNLVDEELEEIGQYAFYGCQKLEYVAINSEKIRTIGNYAFYDCRKFEGLVSSYGIATREPASLNQLETIGIRAFALSGLSEVTLPATVTKIGNYAFEDCPILIAIHAQREDGSLYNCSENAFDGVDKSACKVLVPYGFKYTYLCEPWYQFDNVEHDCLEFSFMDINYVAISDTEAMVVGYSSSREYIEIPETVRSGGWTGDLYNVTSIADHALADNLDVRYIIVPTSITKIGDRAFASCDQLQGVHFYTKAANMGANILDACPELQSICLEANDPSGYVLGGELAEDIHYNNVTLQVPYCCAEAYRAVEPWSRFTNIEEADPIRVSDIQICGTGIYEHNVNDILGDGMFSFDAETNTLTIHGGTCDGNGVENVPAILVAGEEKVTIYVAADATLKAATFEQPTIYSWDTSFTITGPGRLKMTENTEAIRTGYVYVEISRAFLDVAGEYAVQSEDGGLNIEHSIVYAAGTSAALPVHATITDCNMIAPADPSMVNTAHEVVILPDVDLGDVNGDDKVNGSDYVSLADVLLGRQAESLLGDTNGDNKVNGTDLVTLVDILLGRETGAPVRQVPRKEASQSATLSIEPFTIEAGGEATMLIDLNNPSDDITLVQFELSLPDGLDIKSEDDELLIDIAGRTTWKKHTLDANKVDDVWRFLFASSKNNLFDGSEGAIIEVTLVADETFTGGIIAIDKTLLVTYPEKKEIEPTRYEYLVGDEMNVEGLKPDILKKGGNRIYDMSGRRVAKPAKGLYIIDKRKVFVK